MTAFQYCIKARSNLLVRLHAKLTLMLMPRIVLIESKTYSNLTWIRKTHGTHLHLVLYVHQDKPAIFGPKEVTPVARHSLTGSQDAGMYTRSELRRFWDNILVNAAFRSALKNFSQNVIFYSASREGPDGTHYYAPRTEFYVDKMISPEYFRNSFMDTFGPIAYVLEHCGTYFSVFLFPKLNIDLIVMVIRHMEINKLTGASLGFGKTLLSASYNIFMTSVLTSVFDPHAPSLAAIEQNKINPKLGVELKEMRTEEDPNKKVEHLYPIINPTAFQSLSIPLAPV